MTVSSGIIRVIAVDGRNKDTEVFTDRSNEDEPSSAWAAPNGRPVVTELMSWVTEGCDTS